MGKPCINLQDAFLNQIRKEDVEISLVLLDGTRLVGHVKGFDNFTIAILALGHHHLVYKHAVAQIISHRMIERPFYEEPPIEHLDEAPSERSLLSISDKAEQDERASQSKNPKKKAISPVIANENIKKA